MPRRDAFTLLEVVVALALGGVVLIGAHAVLASLGDAAAAITARATTDARTVEGERTLRALAGRLEVGTPEAAPFEGAPDAARFTSWCEVPSGWLERCTVTLAFDSASGAGVLEARIAGRAPVVLARGFRSGAFRYLESAAAGGTWFRRWGTGITAPQAIGVLLDQDTLIVRIGARG